jgi:hypothetical protein
MILFSPLYFLICFHQCLKRKKPSRGVTVKGCSKVVHAREYAKQQHSGYTYMHGTKSRDGLAFKFHASLMKKTFSTFYFHQ